MDQEVQREWHMDRRVTIGLIVALLLNAGSSVWWAATLSSNVDTNRRDITGMQNSLKEVAESQRKMGENLARMDERSNYQVRLLEQMQKGITEK